MINPEQRTLLTDALTPPAGYCFDTGIATTYSLDLVTLLTLPLHLAWKGTEGTTSDNLDPLPILESLRRMGDKLTVFCQRGRLQIPRVANALLGLLEGMVHEAHPLHGGVFHPKVWLLRFVPNDESNVKEAVLRLLVLSRNLTDDRSWDVSLWLEGQPGRKNVPDNKPLVGFIQQMHRMSVKKLTASRSDQLETLCADAARAVWELPGQFESVRFHALGLGSKPVPWLPEEEGGVGWDELGVVSPFVTADALSELADLTRRPLFLLSRAEELDRMDEPPGNAFPDIRVLSEHAVAGDIEEDTPGRLRGLHAKAFIGKRGWNTHVFVGSANATSAALLAGKNVEFMVELAGKYSKVGTPGSWLESDCLGPLLVPYERSEPEDLASVDAERALEALRDALANAKLELRCEKLDEGWAVDLHGLHAVDLHGVKAGAWLVTQDSGRAVSVGGDDQTEEAMRLGVYAGQHVTSFTGFSLELGNSALSFALQLPLHGGPENRDLEILRAAIRNRQGFIRYLLLLLGDWEPADGNGSGTGAWTDRPFVAAHDDTPLFEMLAKAYAHEPEKLGQVSQVVDRLRAEDDSCDEILTGDFLYVWSVFEKVLSGKASK